MFHLHYALIFILVANAMTQPTLPIDHSIQILQEKLMMKRSFRATRIITSSDEILVFGHRNPDTDSIVAALVFADFLRRQGINAKAYRLGDLNNETKFVLRKANIESPNLLSSHVPPGATVAVVDHNESPHSIKDLKQMRVSFVVDHHKLGDLATSEPVYLRFEPVGSTATIITKLYRENKLSIDMKTAILLISAILSDTLHFRSSSTTQDDRSIVDYLLPIAKICNVTDYANQMFAAKSELSSYSMEEILLLDYKTFIFNDQVWGIGVAETFYPNDLLNRTDSLLEVMAKEKQKNQLTGILFSIVDIGKMRNIMIIPGEPETTVIQTAFGIPVNSHMADLGSRISRKKDIIPALELYFKSTEKMVSFHSRS